MVQAASVEAALVPKACGDQSPILETEHPAGVTPGQLEIARVVQLANELHDRGQAKAVERTLSTQPCVRLRRSVGAQRKESPTPGLRVTKPR